MCSSWGVPNDCCYCEAKLFCPHPTMTFRPQIWIVLCCNHQNLWLLPSWLKMSPLKCLLTLTSPANTWGKATMVVVVITSKILILIVVVTVIVATLLLQFSAVPFPTEHVTSSSHRPSKTREREMSTACCDKSSVTLETNPLLLPWQIWSRGGAAAGGHVASPMVGSQLVARARLLSSERKTQAPNPQVADQPHSECKGGFADKW